MKCEAPEQTVKVLEVDEGIHHTPYQDTKKLWTIGTGRLIGRDLEQMSISDDVRKLMLAEDIAEAESDAKFILGDEFYCSLPAARKVAIISLLFTLGRGKFSEFRNTIAAIKSQNWQAAAAGVMASKWARDVDPRQRKDIGRDDRIAFMLKENQFPKDYNV